MLKRYWRGLPWDGLGWAGQKKILGSKGDDRLVASLRQWAAESWCRSKPLLLRDTLWLADRLLWPLAALNQSLAFAQAFKAVSARQLFRDCLMTGASPLEAHLWQRLYGTPHPLPARIAALLMLRLGDAAGHRLLADKLATARHLANIGVVFPALRALCRHGETIKLSDIAMLDGELFVKPRHGSGGHGGFALARVSGAWQMNQRLVTDAALLTRLTRLAQQDDLLLQERLLAAPDLADLMVDGRAPVLRLVTARLPGAAPFLHSAMLSIGLPGRDPRHFLDGTIYAPIDPGTGQMAAGLVLGEPENRIFKLGWNAAPLAGRTLPGFGDAVAIALRAMAALPPLALVHWDIIPTANGPVLLEGNSSGSWILACLPGLYGLDAGPLPPLLVHWMQAAS
ncbi:sugar-transfer associated ATP-grasp domain-containing protein [Ferrovibrio sp.]|uniref:sugar-transfer associated ATP-grasp domain-containing protein n=1 Tax=Ferrovibrio sp. TaxID=1917215 RepID=UPI0025BE418E|nr:sugar-transfer associated ATP-grasp domain-containing protein [Ferrovibrio sp.]